MLALDIAGGEVQSVRSMVNPENIGHVGWVTDLGNRRAVGAVAASIPSRHALSMLSRRAGRIARNLGILDTTSHPAAWPMAGNCSEPAGAVGP